MVEILVLILGIFVGYVIHKIKSTDAFHANGTPCAILLNSGEYREAVLLQEYRIGDKFLIAAWIYESKGERKRSFPIAVDSRKVRFYSSEGDAINTASIHVLNQRMKVKNSDE